MPGAFATHLVFGQSSQFAFHKWDQPVEGGTVAVVPSDEEIGDALGVHK
jgi:hypothetical protein